MKKLLFCIFILLNSCSGPNDINLEVVDFNEFKHVLQFNDNKTYVINFWATWCAPCIKELPYFEKINKYYKNKGVEVILVSLDFPSELDSKLKPFIFENKIDSRIIVLDDINMNSWVPVINKDWDGAIPVTIIYNKNSRAFYPKVFTLEELEKEVNNFINL